MAADLTTLTAHAVALLQESPSGGNERLTRPFTLLRAAPVQVRHAVAFRQKPGPPPA